MVKKRIQTNIPLVLSMLCILFIIDGRGEDDLKFLLQKKPYKFSYAISSSQTTKRSSLDLGRSMLLILADIYQSYISTQDENVCNFTLSCSSFAKDAINKYGIFHGVLISADRLLRCHPLGRRYYLTDVSSRLAIDFTVSNYYLGRRVNN